MVVERVSMVTDRWFSEVVVESNWGETVEIFDASEGETDVAF